MSKVELLPLKQDAVLKSRVYEALRQAIVSMDVYASVEAPKLDERKLADDLGVSRTPVREALSRLEQEGLVRNIPRRGSFVVRKSKREIVEIIEVWAALESMAARLTTLQASDAQLSHFKQHWETEVRTATKQGETDSRLELQPELQPELQQVAIDEYSESNIRFHEDIMELAGNEQILITGRNLFVHMHAIRAATIRQSNRSTRSIIDHGLIIESLVARDTEKAQLLVRDHALELAEHVRKHIDYLE